MVRESGYKFIYFIESISWISLWFSVNKNLMCVVHSPACVDMSGIRQQSKRVSSLIQQNL